MDYLFIFISLVNTLCHYKRLHTKKTEYIWSIYFYILMIYWWKTEMVKHNLSIYFILDAYNEVINNKLTRFTIFHHLLGIILNMLSLFKNAFHDREIDLISLYEISSIPLMLFYMGYISKPIYNILFSYSFIFVRLIYFNYGMYNLYLTNGGVLSNTTTAFLILLNIMNCGITWKMKLVQKLFGIRPFIQACVRPALLK
jgi:hypothetical protein